ncbi:hypothetical protein [Priestia filamentosa]|nr:hypothetical protein [Priestia filamentosa]
MNGKGGRVSIEGITEGSASFLTQAIVYGRILYISLLLGDGIAYYRK